MNYRNGLLRMGVPRETIDKFMRYHDSHSWIWPEFEKRALSEIDEGATRLSSKGIAEEMRKTTSSAGDPFGIDNRFPTYYGCVFALKYPQHAAKFEFRILTGIKSGESNYELAKAINRAHQSGAQTAGIQSAVGASRVPQSGSRFIQQTLLEPTYSWRAIYQEEA